MRYRVLGSTRLRVSEISFGAGPVPALMTASDAAERQVAVVRRALDAGINWFDTAATYGDGRSEEGLGLALQALGASSAIHIATKVRIPPDRVDDMAAVVHESFAASLVRLRVPQVTLLQVHNSITKRRGDQPTSLTPQDVLGPGGVLECFRRLQDAGQVLHLGFTGLGDPEAMAQVIDSGQVATVQTPFNILNPSAGLPAAADSGDVDYGQIIPRCHARGMGVFAIRVFAGGALLDQPPSAHTLTTKFFPLELYERDRRRAELLRAGLSPGTSLARTAVRYVLNQPGVTSALIGFSAPEQVDEACHACEPADGPDTHSGR